MNLRDLLKPEELSHRIDSVIGILSPSYALQRQKARRAHRYYEGATVGRRGDGWNPLGGGSRDETRDLQRLRDRSRDFIRNNGYARKAVGGIVSNVIGTGVVLQLKADGGKRKIKTGTDLWRRWWESKDCDFDGLNTGVGLQRLAMRTLVESGEVLVRKRILPYKTWKEEGKFPLQLQILEPEYLDTAKDTFSIGGRSNQVISGIEFDADGRRVAFHIYKQHPSLSGFTLESVRVPANEVIHLFRIDRPGQIRGVPWGAGAFLNLHDLDGYEDAELMRRKIAACFAGFITDSDFDDAAVTDPTRKSSIVDKLEPGMLEVLPPGKSITFGTPPVVQGYSEFPNSILHKISAAYEVPYTVLTGDYSQVNFSSGRMGWLEFQRMIEEWRWTLLVPRFLDPVYLWFKQIAEIIETPLDGVSPTWTAPRREMIDPEKEIKAMALSVRNGFTTLSEAIKELGYDPDQNIDEISEINQKLDKAGIILDSDPRKDPQRIKSESIA